MYKAAFFIAVTAIFANTAFGLPGSGTEADPWRIQSLADFNAFAADSNYWDDYTRLETDVNLTGVAYTTAVIAPDMNNTNSVFDGIAFTGVFDGNGCKVVGLTIDDQGVDNRYLGLFGYINAGRIQRLGVTNSSVSGYAYVGSLLGMSYSGNILDCYSTGEVAGDSSVGGLIGLHQDGLVSCCYSTCSVHADTHAAGGLVGYTNNGMVSICYYTGTVYGEFVAGGLIGKVRNGSTVSHCYSTGDVTGDWRVGGLVGDVDGIVFHCSSSSDVGGRRSVGGLVGRNDSDGIVSNCFWNSEVQSHTIDEGVGNDDGTTVNVSGLSNAEMQTVNTFTSAGWDFLGESANGTSEIWHMIDDSGPVLRFFHNDLPFPLAGAGTAENPYLISDANEFGMVRWYPEDSCFKLTGDIDLSGITWSAPVIPRFRGCFDGDGHKLINLRVLGGDKPTIPIGLIGCLDEGGRVKGLGLEGGSVEGSESSRVAGIVIGGLVGENWGSISDSYSSGDVSGYGGIGGLVGYNYLSGRVVNCNYAGNAQSLGWDLGGLVGRNEGGLVLTSHCTGTLNGGPDAGGIVGCNRSGGSVFGCYFAGEINGGSGLGGIVGENNASVYNCHSAGDVSGNINVGGLVGDNDNSGQVWNCYSMSNVNGNANVGGAVGLNDRACYVSNCSFGGTVNGNNYVGGLAGSSGGDIWHCYSAGDVNGVDSVGGLVGRIRYSSSTSYSFWDGDTQSHGVAESIGYLEGGTTNNIARLSTPEMQIESTFSSAGWDFMGESANGMSETWRMPDGGGYPALSFLYGDILHPLQGSGTTSDPYLIGDANELGMMSWYPEDSFFKLTGDIDLSGAMWSVPVAPRLSGCLDGDDHKVVNLDISGYGWLGLIGYLKEGGEIRNLGLEGCSVSGTRRYTGGLAGVNVRGTVSNCYTNGIIAGADRTGGLIGYNSGSISDCYSTGETSGWSEVGGLVGFNHLDSTMLSCYSTCNTSGVTSVGALVGRNEGTVSTCNANSSVSGDSSVGGLIGYNDGSYDKSGDLFNSYSTGVVNGGWSVGGLIGGSYEATTSNCYSTSDVSGESHVGGLIGRSRNDSVSDCYSIGDVNGVWEVGGLIGMNRSIISNCYSIGMVCGDDVVGGFVGLNEVQIIDCYSSGSICGIYQVGGFVGSNDGGTISNCYHSGSVSGMDTVGGLVARNEVGGTVLNSFWDVEMQSDGVTESFGDNDGTATNVVGLLTADMQIRDTFTSAGWDFASENDNGTGDFWDICEGTNYPRFVWQIRATDFLCPNGITGKDLAVFASFWLRDDCGPANQYCSGADLDVSGRTDGNDLVLFAEDWLHDAALLVLGPQPPNDPSPLDGAIDIQIDSVLSWQPGYGATSHKVYLGLTNCPVFQGNQQSTVFEPNSLAFGTTYYWRIDEVNEVGTTRGPAWSFTTGSPPDPATAPEPSDGAVDTEIDPVLSWIPSSTATSHDVYFGTTSPGTFQRNQVGTSFVPGTLEHEQIYYWRIDELNVHGTTTGPVWSFTTESGKRLRCFPADTVVWADGEVVRIVDVVPGQKVGMADSTAEVEWIQEHGVGAYDCYDVVFESGNSIVVVHSHHFLAVSGEWVAVENLSSGSELQSLNGAIGVSSVVKRAMPFVGNAYNLKIKGANVFFVGEDGVAAVDCSKLPGE